MIETKEITILVDNKQSWFFRYAKLLSDNFKKFGYNSKLIHDKNEIEEGDILFILSCTRILPSQYLTFNTHNIVIHASDLPLGKGFSPLQWQILEGKNSITLTLFEAVEELDAGDYYFKSNLNFDGSELLEELRHKMALKINEMAFFFVQNSNKLPKNRQIGASTYYPKRKKTDDQINPNRTIIELFNHFRIADNEKFPLFFEYLNEKYFIRIEKVKKDVL